MNSLVDKIVLMPRLVKGLAQFFSVGVVSATSEQGRSSRFPLRLRYLRHRRDHAEAARVRGDLAA